MGEAVRYERSGAIGVITLDRPDNRNSMTPEVLDAFARASAAAHADDGARCVVVRGTGSCFSAGADFKSVVQRGGDQALPHERSYAMYVPFLSVLDLRVPVLAALNGHAVGGGFGLALLCDLRVASRTAKLGANFCRLGLAPGMGISATLPRAIGDARAAELLYTGRLLSGEEAAAWGLVSYAVDAADVVPRTMAIAEEIAASAPLAVAATRAALRSAWAEEIRRVARHEAHAQADTIASADFTEGVAALLEKRAPRFSGS